MPGWSGDTAFDRDAARDAGIWFVGVGCQGDARVEAVGEILGSYRRLQMISPFTDGVADAGESADIGARISLDHREVGLFTRLDPSLALRLPESLRGRSRQRRENLVEGKAGARHELILLGRVVVGPIAHVRTEEDLTAPAGKPAESFEDCVDIAERREELERRHERYSWPSTSLFDEGFIEVLRVLDAVRENVDPALERERDSRRQRRMREEELPPRVSLGPPRPRRRRST